MVEFCSRHGIPYEVCGKLIVATNAEEAARLDELLSRGVANGLEGLRLLERAAIQQMEPHVGGVRALHVPSTGITDYALVTAKYAEITAGHGAEVKTSAGVVGFSGLLPEILVRGVRWWSERAREIFRRAMW